MKKSGKVRFTGVTSHSNMVEVMDAAVRAGFYDTVLTSFNFLSPPGVADAIGRAADAGLGVVAMKTMSGGYQGDSFPGLNPYQAALRWVLSFFGWSARGDGRPMCWAPRLSHWRRYRSRVRAMFRLN